MMPNKNFKNLLYKLGSVRVGKNCRIAKKVSIDRDVFIEDNVSIGSGVRIGSEVKIDNDVIVGNDTRLWGCEIGKRTRIETRVTILGKHNATNILIGQDCYLGMGTILDGKGGEISIGNETHLAANASVWTHSAAFYVTKRQEKKIGQDVTIGQNSWIGGGVCVYPGIKIGDRVIVFPNSVVNRNLVNDSIWSGNPIQRKDRKK